MSDAERESALGYVLARRPQGEREHFVDLLLEDGSLREGVSRGGTSASARMVGSLQPFVRYRFVFGRTGRGGVRRILEASAERAHAGLLATLHRSAAAGVAGAFAREVGVGYSEDRGPYERYAGLLAALEGADAASAGGLLVRFVFEAYEVAGHPLVLDACVRCGKTAPENALVRVSSGEGGTVCGACGHGALALSSAGRRALRRVCAGEDAAFVAAMLPWLARALGAQTPRGARVLRSAAAHWGVAAVATAKNPA